jgi:flagellar capping protein FliD
MSDLAQFSVLAALIIGGFGVFAFMFQRLESRMIGGENRLDGRMDRLESRMDRLEERISSLERIIPAQFEQLRRDLAEEFRAQRAEMSNQITAITNAIIATRKD